MIVRKTIDVSAPLTEEQKKMLTALDGRQIVFDEDCPPLPKEIIRQFKPVSKERKMYLRSLGKGEI